LFKVDLGLNWKNTSVCLLEKEVLRPLHSTFILEEGEGPEDFFLVVGELIWGQAQIQHAEVEEGSSGAPFTREVRGRGEFWPCSLFRWSGWSRGGFYYVNISDVSGSSKRLSFIMLISTVYSKQRL